MSKTERLPFNNIFQRNSPSKLPLNTYRENISNSNNNSNVKSKNKNIGLNKSRDISNTSTNYFTPNDKMDNKISFYSPPKNLKYNHKNFDKFKTLKINKNSSKTSHVYNAVNNSSILKNSFITAGGNHSQPFNTHRRTFSNFSIASSIKINNNLNNSNNNNNSNFHILNLNNSSNYNNKSNHNYYKNVYPVELLERRKRLLNISSSSSNILKSNRDIKNKIDKLLKDDTKLFNSLNIEKPNKNIEEKRVKFNFESDNEEVENNPNNINNNELEIEKKQNFNFNSNANNIEKENLKNLNSNNNFNYSRIIEENELNFLENTPNKKLKIKNHVKNEISNLDNNLTKSEIKNTQNIFNQISPLQISKEMRKFIKTNTINLKSINNKTKTTHKDESNINQSTPYTVIHNTTKSNKKEVFDKLDTNKKLNEFINDMSNFRDCHRQYINKIPFKTLAKNYEENIIPYLKNQTFENSLKFDFLHRITTGDIVKDEFQTNFMQKMIPGNYINSGYGDSFKISVLQPRFIKLRFKRNIGMIDTGLTK